MLTYANLVAIDAQWWRQAKERMRKEWHCDLSYRKKRNSLSAERVPYTITLRGEQVAQAFDVFLQFLLDENSHVVAVDDFAAYLLPSIFLQSAHF